MTAHEGVLSCLMSAAKILNSSFAEVDDMDLVTLAELLSVYDKMSDAGKRAFIDDIL